MSIVLVIRSAILSAILFRTFVNNFSAILIKNQDFFIILSAYCLEMSSANYFQTSSEIPMGIILEISQAILLGTSLVIVSAIYLKNSLYNCFRNIFVNLLRKFL